MGPKVTAMGMADRKPEYSKDQKIMPKKMLERNQKSAASEKSTLFSISWHHDDPLADLFRNN